MRSLAAFWVWHWMDVNYPNAWYYGTGSTRMYFAAIVWTLIVSACIAEDICDLFKYREKLK